MDISAKLQIKSGQKVAVVGVPEGVPPFIDTVVNPPADPRDADTVVAFLRRAEDLDTVAGPAVAAARLDKLAWIAYPKAGQLGTDVNRDILAGLLALRDVQPVRQVAINEIWSALRLRPA
jgi:hypothetical protein